MARKIPLEKITTEDAMSRINKYTKPLSSTLGNSGALPIEAPVANAAKWAVPKVLKAGIGGGLGAVATDALFPDKANDFDDVAAINNYSRIKASPVASHVPGARLSPALPQNPAIARPQQMPDNDLTVNQQLSNINRARNRRERIDIGGIGGGSLPEGVTGFFNVVGDTNESNFRFNPKQGALFTDAGIARGNTRMSEVADAVGQVREQRAALPAPVIQQPVDNYTGSVDYFLEKIDPFVRGLAPMRALRVAGDQAEKYSANRLARENLDATRSLKQQELDQEFPLRQAHADYYNAQTNTIKQQSSPEYLEMLNQQRRQKENAEITKDIYSSIKDRVLPPGFEGKHLEIAKVLAAANDPESDVGAYYIPGKLHMQGIAAKRSVFEPLLQKYKRAGYPDENAYSYAVNDLKDLERTKRVKLSKPIPYIDRLPDRTRKAPEELFMEQP